MKIDYLILEGRKKACSDIHVSVGLPVMFRVNGMLQETQMFMTDAEISDMLLEILDENARRKLEEGLDAEFMFCSADGERQRIHVFKQQGKLAVAIRLFSGEIPTMDRLGIPGVLQKLADQKSGLVFVAGPAGAGKSTTVASLIDYINATRQEYIITIEKPVEYKYDRKSAFILQREVGTDVRDFASGLQSALREDADVIYVSDIKDYDTFSVALDAAEAGKLVFASMCAMGVVQTIEHILNLTPEKMQNQVRNRLAGVMNGMMTQCLIPTKNGDGRVTATETLIGNEEVCELIRENSLGKLMKLMQSDHTGEMHTLNSDLVRLVEKGKIRKEDAFKYSNNRRELEKNLK